MRQTRFKNRIEIVSYTGFLILLLFLAACVAVITAATLDAYDRLEQKYQILGDNGEVVTICNLSKNGGTVFFDCDDGLHHVPRQYKIIRKEARG